MAGPWGSAFGGSCSSGSVRWGGCSEPIGECSPQSGGGANYEGGCDITPRHGYSGPATIAHLSDDSRPRHVPSGGRWNDPLPVTEMKKTIITRLLAIGCVLLAALLATADFLAAAEAGGGVVIPNFWDPKRRVERPAAGAVTAIRFITTDDYPPFNFLGPDGQLTGFNVDLARAICTELAVACTIQARPWSDLVNALKNGSADAAIAGIAISEASLKELDFSDPYLRSPARFVVRRSGPALAFTPAGLTGRTVAAAGGTAHQAYLARFFPGAVVRPYANADAARAALKAGEVDALFGDGVQSSFWLQSEAAADCCAFAGGPYLEERYFGEGM